MHKVIIFIVCNNTFVKTLLMQKKFCGEKEHTLTVFWDCKSIEKGYKQKNHSFLTDYSILFFNCILWKHKEVLKTRSNFIILALFHSW